MIRQGRVKVNGKVAKLGDRADPRADRVEVDGDPVVVDERRVYFAMNKPEGVITTAKDERGRTTVLDLLGIHERVFPVGRLDAATEGLLLLTNDGELANRITHPSFGVEKVYVADVTGSLGRSSLKKLKQGVDIGGDRPAVASDVKVISSGRHGSVVEVVVHEGRTHVVRRMFDAVGHPVQRLVRTAVGPVRLGRLKQGSYRRLTPQEVSLLYRETGL